MLGIVSIHNLIQDDIDSVDLFSWLHLSVPCRIVYYFSPLTLSFGRFHHALSFSRYCVRTRGLHSSIQNFLKCIDSNMN